MIEEGQLHAYVDGEMAAVERASTQALIDGSPEAAAEVVSIRSLKNALSTKLEAPECSAEWSRCQERIEELKKSRRAQTFVSRYGWGMACVLFAFIVFAGIFNRNADTGSMQGADLARAVASLTPVGGPRSQEASDVQQFLDSLVGQAGQSIRAGRLEMVGGETGQVDGRRIARVQFRDAEGDLSLIVMSGVLEMDKFAPMEGTRFRSGKIQGVNLIAWSDGESSIVLAGQRSYEDLVSVAELKLLR